MKQLLLISSSKTHGTKFLEHASEAIKKHLQRVRRVTFVPFALANRDAYARLAKSAFQEMGFEMESLHATDDSHGMLGESEAVFIGGGNTFRLLKTLYDLNLLDPLRQRIVGGMPYMGSSAGTNITGPTIRTTNDMPIVQPPSFEALGVVPFQINPHFIDPDINSTHQGESRETRLNEYHEENTLPVLGIREGCWLEIVGDEGWVRGSQGAVLFEANRPRRELPVEESIQFLLTSVTQGST